MWELLKVYGEPPKIGFTWRHWGAFNGEFNNNKGNNQLIEMYGFGTATVKMPNDNDPYLRIQNFEVYSCIRTFVFILHIIYIICLCSGLF